MENVHRRSGVTMSLPDWRGRGLFGTHRAHGIDGGGASGGEESKNPARFTRQQEAEPDPADPPTDPARFTPRQEAEPPAQPAKTRPKSGQVHPTARSKLPRARPVKGFVTPSRSKVLPACRFGTPTQRRPGSPHSKKQTPTGSPGQRIRRSESVQSTAGVPIWNPAPRRPRQKHEPSACVRRWRNQQISRALEQLPERAKGLPGNVPLRRLPFPVLHSQAKAGSRIALACRRQLRVP